MYDIAQTHTHSPTSGREVTNVINSPLSQPIFPFFVLLIAIYFVCQVKKCAFQDMLFYVKIILPESVACKPMVTLRNNLT